MDMRVLENGTVIVTNADTQWSSTGVLKQGYSTSTDDYVDHILKYGYQYALKKMYCNSTLVKMN